MFVPDLAGNTNTTFAIPGCKTSFSGTGSHDP